MSILPVRYRLPYALLLPTALVIAAVILYPFLYNFWISLSNMSLYHVRDAHLIGFDNYGKIFLESELYTVLAKTIAWTGINVFFHVVIGVGVALLLNQQVRGRGIFRALLILPWAMPQYIVALTWRGMFNYQYGAINLILERFGIDPVPWLSHETGAFAAATITNIWLGFPFMMIIALGGLQSIPDELYEAASIDGASAWQKLRRVTIPMLKPIMVPAISLGTIWTFNNLNVIWLVTRGGEPADQTHILVTYVYKAAFSYYRYGYAAAFSVMIFLVLLGFILWYMKTTRVLAEAR
ncbi:MAG: sugar ABC transporter permease [Candidatus Eisenbacteria sp.]|nr:sugar ABC transporter permease [Candidatus Eisenbacteria bacterium]